MTVARRRNAGDPILHQEWNNLIARIQRLEEQLARFGIVPGAVPPVAMPFRYKSSDGDVIVARPYLEATEITEDYYIAKPYLLRPSITSRGGFTYTYTNDFTRESTKTADSSTEDQVVTPGYVEDDIVYAVRCPYYTGVVYDPGTGNIPIEWLEIGIRMWSQDSA